MMPGTNDLRDWIRSLSGPDWLLHVKFIAANDTYAKPNVHQGGVYVSKGLLHAAFPQLVDRVTREENPDIMLPIFVDSHNDHREVRLVWYNSKVYKQRRNGRDEARLTQWGSIDHPVVDAETTGSLGVFAFQVRPDRDAETCRVWISRSAAETDAALELLGPVEPGIGLLISASGVASGRGPDETDRPCTLTANEIRDQWGDIFPRAEEVVRFAISRIPSAVALPPDGRLMKRRDCEFGVFRSIEELVAMPRIREGFNTIGEFLELAHRVTNRRKARSGRSLEIQASAIFDEESLPHTNGGRTEGKRTPDFIFPSIEHYHDRNWPDRKLRMLGAKTTCKDRWRQVLNEADRLPQKYLLTLQEGVSQAQFEEMRESDLILVVPKGLHKKYPDTVRPHLVALETFIAETKTACS